MSTAAQDVVMAPGVAPGVEPQPQQMHLQHPEHHMALQHHPMGPPSTMVHQQVPLHIPMPLPAPLQQPQQALPPPLAPPVTTVPTSLPLPLPMQAAAPVALPPPPPPQPLTHHFSSFPSLHYLQPFQSAASPPDLTLISCEGLTLHTHQALVGAAFATLKRGLLEPKIAVEESAVILFPDHTQEQVHLLLRTAYGQIAVDQIQDAEVRQLLLECGFMAARFPPPGSIARIKTEIVIPDDDENEKENHRNNSSNVARKSYKSEANDDDDSRSSDDEYEPPSRKKKRRGRKYPKELEDFIDDEDDDDDDDYAGKTEPYYDDDDDDEFEPRSLLDVEIKGEAEFDAEAGQCNQCREDFTTEDDFNSHMPCSKAKKVFCEDCGALLNKYSLYNHRKSCSGQQTNYACNVCGDNSATTLRRLDEHCMEAHGMHAKIPCRFCQAIYHWGGIGRHMSKCESNPNRTLDACGNPIATRKRRGRPPKSMSRQDDANFHRKAAPLDNGTGFRCLGAECDEKYATKKEILRHYRSMHVRQHKCDHCEERFAGKRDYQVHLKDSHDILDDGRVMCDKCGYDVCKSGMKKHIEKCDGTLSSTNRLFRRQDFKPHPDDPRRCPEPECDFSHDSMGQVRLHYRKRHVKIACEHCNTKVSIYFYEEHLTKIHQLTTPKKAKLSCDECNLKFCFKSHLVEHMERVHIREPKYVCDICGAAHFSKRLLIQHRYETHIRSRKNTCEVCGVVMRSVKPLITHLKDIHGLTVPKDYKPPGSTKQ